MLSKLHEILRTEDPWLMYPFEVRQRIRISGIELSLITHLQDKVIGAWIRGEVEFCRHSLAELEVLQGAIKPGHTVLDVGANIGVFSVVLGKHEPTASIYAFEPDPVNYALLNMNLRLNDIHNATAFEIALGKKEECIPFYKSRENFGDHRSARTQSHCPGVTSGSQVDVLSRRVLKANPVRVLESYLDDGPSSINVLKIDTQGADLEILDACMPLLLPGSIVSIEYSPYHLAVHGTTRDDVECLLARFSRIERIAPMGESPRLQHVSMEQIVSFYEERNSVYSTYWDLLVTY